MLGLQFVLVATLKRVAAPFGEDALVHFRRYMGYAGTIFILAHPIGLIVLVDTSYLERVNPLTAPWAGRFGTLAIVCLVAVVVTSIWRVALRISYEVWQGIHLVLSTVAITAAVVHVELIGHYVNQPWKRVLWAVMTAGFIAVFLWVRIIWPVHRMRRPWTIAVARGRGGVASITLVPDGHRGFTFSPGQFGWLSVHRSPFALTQHPFSFSSNGDDPSALQMSITELGDFTATITSIVPGPVPISTARTECSHPTATPDPDLCSSPAEWGSGR